MVVTRTLEVVVRPVSVRVVCTERYSTVMRSRSARGAGSAQLRRTSSLIRRRRSHSSAHSGHPWVCLVIRSTISPGNSPSSASSSP